MRWVHLQPQLEKTCFKDRSNLLSSLLFSKQLFVSSSLSISYSLSYDQTKYIQINQTQMHGVNILPNQSGLFQLTRQRDKMLLDSLDKIKEVQMSSLNALSLLQTLPQINANLERVALLLERGISSPTQASPHQSSVPSAPKVLNQAPVLLQPIQSQPKQSQKVIEAKTEEPTQEKDQIKQSSQVKSVAIQTQKEQKPVQQTQIKESINKQSEFPRCMSVVPFQQNNIIIDFQGFLNRTGKSEFSGDELKIIMCQWLSTIYEQITKKAWMGYFSRYLSHEQTKIFFTKNVVINFTRFAQYVYLNFKPLWKDKSIELIEHFQKQSSKILEYTAVKFPQQQKTYVSAQVKEAIQSFDHSDEPELDYLFNTGIVFPNYYQFEEYLYVVKNFLNQIMELTDTHAKRWIQLMKDLFNVDGKELSNQVDAKFKENTPKFSIEQIYQRGIKIKAPQVLRVIVKWAEELEKKCYDIDDGTILRNKFYTSEGKIVLLTQKMKDAAAIRSWQEIQRIQEKSVDMLMELRQVASLFPQFLKKYEENFQYLDSNNVKSGLFSYVVSQTASHLTINYLIFLIESLKKKAEQIEDQASPRRRAFIAPDFQSTHKRGTQEEVFRVQFVSFKISDLLRSKCVGTLQQIKKVYEKLKNHPDLKVYRVKNRIDTSNRDFLVNVQLKGTPMLCEVQLKILQKAADQKQSYISHFSHLLYQLSRAKYGPMVRL